MIVGSFRARTFKIIDQEAETETKTDKQMIHLTAVWTERRIFNSALDDWFTNGTVPRNNLAS